MNSTMTPILTTISTAVGDSFAPRRGRGRPPIPAHEVSCMRKLRAEGITLLKISYFTERSICTVFKYTASVPCARRHNKAIKINRRTGLAV